MLKRTNKGVFILHLFFILFDSFLSIVGQGTRITHPLHICYSVFFFYHMLEGLSLLNSIYLENSFS